MLDDSEIRPHYLIDKDDIFFRAKLYFSHYHFQQVTYDCES